MDLIQIAAIGNELVWVCDQAGLPIKLDDARRIHELIGAYIATRSEADIDRFTREVVATRYPSMYPQMFGEK